MMTGATCKSMLRLGLASLALVVGKSGFEAVTGRIPFAWLHLGWVGFPIAVCHAGGVLGALLVWIAVQASRPTGRESTFKLDLRQDIKNT